MTQRRSSLTFCVGPYTYKLVVASHRIYFGDNQEAEGLCMDSPRLIVLSKILAPRRRAQVALHELAHAFEWAFGVPTEVESRCDHLATVALDFTSQLRRQGGEAALRSLRPMKVPGTGKLPRKKPKTAAWRTQMKPAWLAGGSGFVGLAASLKKGK